MDVEGTTYGGSRAARNAPPTVQRARTTFSCFFDTVPATL